MEIWKAVVGEEGIYEVSNLGQVRSLDHKLTTVDGRTISRYGVTKVLRVTHLGYLRVKIHRKYQMVHRVVAEAFIPNPENKPFVNHIDGNKFNNTPENLEWVTHTENIQHAHKNGLVRILSGENHGMAKITERDVIYIRTHAKKRDKEFGYGALGRKFGISKQMIRDIVEYRNWKHVKMEKI